MLMQRIQRLVRAAREQLERRVGRFQREEVHVVYSILRKQVQVSEVSRDLWLGTVREVSTESPLHQAKRENALSTPRLVGILPSLLNPHGEEVQLESQQGDQDRRLRDQSIPVEEIPALGFLLRGILNLFTDKARWWDLRIVDFCTWLRVQGYQKIRFVCLLYSRTWGSKSTLVSRLNDTYKPSEEYMARLHLARSSSHLALPAITLEMTLCSRLTEVSLLRSDCELAGRSRTVSSSVTKSIASTDRLPSLATLYLLRCAECLASLPFSYSRYGFLIDAKGSFCVVLGTSLTLGGKDSLLLIAEAFLVSRSSLCLHARNAALKNTSLTQDGCLTSPRLLHWKASHSSHSSLSFSPSCERLAPRTPRDQHTPILHTPPKIRPGSKETKHRFPLPSLLLAAAPGDNTLASDQELEKVVPDLHILLMFDPGKRSGTCVDDPELTRGVYRNRYIHRIFNEEPILGPFATCEVDEVSDCDTAVYLCGRCPVGSGPPAKPCAWIIICCQSNLVPENQCPTTPSSSHHPSSTSPTRSQPTSTPPHQQTNTAARLPRQYQGHSSRFPGIESR
ncbi:hypothetical protein KC325_g148 [Hortaea werneckii]|nr:hypothetical protein KC325_g148 [Hortaea werneckii]